MSDLVPIRTLDLVLTSRCNLKCAYCFENDKKDLRMSWGVAQAGLDRALASATETVDVVFFGGEPALEFPLIRRSVAYVRARAAGRKLRFNLITNGTLLGPRELDFLEANAIDVSISFDGVPQAQAFRGKGTFEALDALLDHLREERAGFFESHVSVSMTLHPRSVPYVADSVAYFLEKGVATIDMAPKITFDPSWRTEDIETLDAAFQRVYRACLRHVRETGQIPFALFRRQRGERSRRPRSLSMCGVGSGEKVAVDVDGQSHGCILFADSYQKFPSAFLKDRFTAMRMGDVRSEDFEARRDAYRAAASGAGMFDAKQDKYSSYGRCGECRFLATCSVCPTGIGHIPGNTDPHRVPDFACAFNLVVLKYRSKFPLPGTARFEEGSSRRDRRVRELMTLARSLRRRAKRS